MKEQQLGETELSKRVARLLSMYKVGEDVHELSGEPPSFKEDHLVIRRWIEELSDFSSDMITVGSDGRPYQEILNLAVPLYVKMLWSELFNYASRTRKSGVEFLHILLEDGRYVILEGEENEVTVPYPRGVAVTHTHPNICLFSSTDLRSADRALIMGYMIDAVMTSQCITVLYRIGPYTEEDRNQLLSRARRVDSERTLEGILEAEMIKIGNLRTLMVRP